MAFPYSNIDKPLVKRLVKGDESAFKMVYEVFYDKLYFYCLQFVKSEDLARELMQDIFVKLWVYREKINPDLSLNAYLYKITRNHTFDFLKKINRDQKLKEELVMKVTLSHSHTDPEDKLVSAEYDVVANQAVQKLPRQRKLIFQLSRHNGMSYGEIATTLGISKNTVKVQMFRALKTVRKYLQIHTDLTITIIVYLSIPLVTLS